MAAAALLAQQGDHLVGEVDLSGRSGGRICGQCRVTSQGDCQQHEPGDREDQRAARR